ncbi:MAG TPA: hypothetical protein VL572_11100 [Pyrinomonadaceae bacterium]|nr:hypothetical protein [Pyrinomonadaceae bacterium]
MRSLLLFAASFAIFAHGGCGGSGETVYGIIDLVEKVTSDEAAWTGKEVVVTGYPSLYDGNTDPIKLNLVEDLYSGTESHIYCSIPKAAVSEDLRSRRITVKGKIGKVHTQNYLNLKTVTLEACEIKGLR